MNAVIAAVRALQPLPEECFVPDLWHYQDEFAHEDGLEMFEETTSLDSHAGESPKGWAVGWPGADPMLGDHFTPYGRLSRRAIGDACFPATGCAGRSCRSRPPPAADCGHASGSARRSLAAPMSMCAVASMKSRNRCRDFTVS